MSDPIISGLPPLSLILTVVGALALALLVSLLLRRRSEMRLRSLALRPVDPRLVDDLFAEASGRMGLLDAAYAIAERRRALGERSSEIAAAAGSYSDDLLEVLDELVRYLRASLARTPAPASSAPALLRDEMLALELCMLLGAARRAGRALKDAPGANHSDAEAVDAAVTALRERAAALLDRSGLYAGFLAAVAERES
jgi:hypothetical protein